MAKVHTLTVKNGATAKQATDDGTGVVTRAVAAGRQ